MNIGLIDNNAHNTLETYLQNVAQDATALDWSSAFITNAGLNSVLYLLTAAAKKGKVRVITGFYQAFTEPAALRTLLKAQAQSAGQLEVRISRDVHFHWKAYFVFGKKTVRAVVGSSNLTNDGLATSGEFNLSLTFPKDYPQLKPLHGLFVKHWDHNAVPLNEAIVDAYAKHHKKLGAIQLNRNIPLQEILGKANRITSINPAATRYFRFSIAGVYSKSTEAHLAKTTNWDKKRYLHCVGAKSFQTGDRAVLFDFESCFVRIIEIIDTLRSPLRTPDGVYFAAYRFDKKIPLRRWTKSRRESLKAAGLISGIDDAYQERKLTPKKFQEFIDNLKKPV